MTDAPQHGPEKRKFVRLKKTVLVYYQMADPDNIKSPLEVEHVASSLDLSASGMMLRTTQNIPLESLIHVKFQPSIIGRELTLLAKVLRHEETQYEGIIYIPIEFQWLRNDFFANHILLRL